MSSRRAQLLAVFLAAVAFRVALFFSGAVDVVYMTGDSAQYDELARSLLHGRFAEHGLLSMNRTPGYPAFLALVYATLGTAQWALTAVQIAVDALTCTMVVDLAIRLRQRRAAVVGVAILAVTCLFTATYSFEVMTETIYTFAVTFALWIIVDDDLVLAPWRVAAAGVALGYGILVRPALASSALLVAACLAFEAVRAAPLALGWRRLVPAALFSLALLAVVTPWTVRNRVRFAEAYAHDSDGQATPLGYKCPNDAYKHYYAPKFNRYLASYEEPFVHISPYEPPVVARWVYPGEPAEVAAAFAKLAADIAQTGRYRDETLDDFARITQRRYRAAPRLYLTAPLSKMARLWITPRIAVLWKDVAGHNSPRRLVVGMTLYSVLYVGLGFAGLVLGLRRRWPFGALFVGSMVVGHTFSYAVWPLPMPQSRYAVVLLPLLSLCAGAFVDAWLTRRSRDGQQRAAA